MRLTDHPVGNMQGEYCNSVQHDFFSYKKEVNVLPPC